MMIVYHDQKIPQWRSLGHLLREQAEKIGARTLLRFEGESLSFAQVEEDTNRLANVLRQHHVQKGIKSPSCCQMVLNFRWHGWR